MDFSLTAKYSRSYDPSTTEIPEVSQSVENSPEEKSTPEPRSNFSPSDPSLVNLLSDIAHTTYEGREKTQRPNSGKKDIKRPKSARLLVSSPLISSPESVGRLSRLTSSAAVTSLYNVISERVRQSGRDSLQPEDLQDIKYFFETEQKQFETALSMNVCGKTLTPYEIHRRDKTKLKNVETQLKHEAIAEKKHEEAVQLAEKAVKMLRASMKDRLSLHIQRMGQRLERQRRCEETQFQREQSRKTVEEKQIIISNIRNFYRDRIELLKEKIEEERMRDKMRLAEQRRTLAKAESERRAQRKALMESKTEHDQLQALSQERLEDELIRLYKRS